MTKITFEITEDQEDRGEIDDIIRRCKEIGGDVNIDIIINTPWPKMVIGDTFLVLSNVDSNTEYVFLRYLSSRKLKAVTKAQVDENSVMQAEYFDCSRDPGNIIFDYDPTYAVD